ncbi:MAG: hypothetical protein IPK55_15305 [Streptococcus sp.]|nr:hypothetical protein [Streptococcus sp.]
METKALHGEMLLWKQNKKLHHGEMLQLIQTLEVHHGEISQVENHHQQQLGDAP